MVLSFVFLFYYSFFPIQNRYTVCVHKRLAYNFWAKQTNMKAIFKTERKRESREHNKREESCSLTNVKVQVVKCKYVIFFFLQKTRRNKRIPI